MKSSLLLTLGITFAAATLEAAPTAGSPQSIIDRPRNIGSPGNSPDKNGLGAVNYSYNISRRVNNEEYAFFLNTVDSGGSNSLGLYPPKMESLGEIEYFADAPEGKHYVARKESAKNPVRNVTWTNAARFVNWLSNGAKSDSSTETGTYNLTTSNGTIVPKNPDSRYWIPNENELYKAAFYRDGKYAKKSRIDQNPTLDAVGELVSDNPGVLNPVGEHGTVDENGLKLLPAPVGEKVDDLGDSDDGFRVAWKPRPPAVAEETPDQPESVEEGPDTNYVPVTYPYPSFINFGPLNGVINPPVDDTGDLPPAS